NFLSMPKQFAPWTWSLAVEEQFYFLLPVSLVLMYKFVRRPWLLFTGLTIFVVALRGYISYTHHVTLPLKHVMLDHDAGVNFFDNIHAKIWTRFGGFLWGVAVAYAMRHTNWASAVRGRRGLQASLLAFAIAGVGAELLIPMFDLNRTFSTAESVLFF